MFFFVCVFFYIWLYTFAGVLLICFKSSKRQDIMFNILNLIIWNIVGHIRYVTQKENFKHIRASFVAAGNSFNL